MGPAVVPGGWYYARRGNLQQIVGCRDICTPHTVDHYRERLPGLVDLVYSDPPWNPGNEKYWRRHAGIPDTAGYQAFLKAWHAVVAECYARGAMHVLCEQSSNPKHHRMLTDERTGWDLPLLETWTVFYGSPSSISCKLPNILMHFGHQKLRTDPAGMAGEAMTIRACAGLNIAPGSWIVDPCLGKGMTSRMAHYFGWNLVGTEIHPARLQKALDWLARMGYEISEDR